MKQQMYDLTAEQIKAKALPMVCAADRRESLRKNSIAYDEYLDMLILCYLPCSEGTDSISQLPITTDMLERVGLTWNELIGAAQDNAKKTYVIWTMNSIMEGFGLFSDFNSDPMLVVTNQRMSYGAAAITCKDVLEDLHSIYHDYYILPSSVHELIAIPATLAGTVEDLVNLVRQINRTEVSEDDRLADNVYHYEQGKLIAAVG